MMKKTHKLELPQHKQEFLKKNGFELDYDGGIILSLMGTVKTRMLLYKKVSNSIYEDVWQLYIHFSEDEPAYCNLYYGSENDECEIFSERNLISEMKKREFKEEKNENY